MEQMHTTFVTDHKPSVNITSMTRMTTTSTTMANFWLQTWAIFLSQYADHMTLTYTHGKDMEVPDALSRMWRVVSDRTRRLCKTADLLKPEGPMGDFEVDPVLWSEGCESTAVHVHQDAGLRSKMRLAYKG